MLIDGDSLSSKIMEGLFGVTAMHGDATIRHIHHDWTQANMRGWKKPACCGVSCRK
ncbi:MULTISPECIES: NYN domain-containing protein [Agrobacterium]|uniref:NYN domain-containing protein n=1 Tax=Agrobacterium tumefaciens TaxID=358 RepID=A0AAE6BGK8_AGRTU|nr:MULTISPECIES: NYN domain-containing protein [Agrobacterium]QCL76704.1 NYN domain-containing protein [Agrobacterium tumefaciens]QCL82224.1 NYN domain-containing protein [Agrobacterium tumefaciens]